MQSQASHAATITPLRQWVFRIWALLLLAFAASACGSNLPEISAAQANANAMESYQLAPGDKLKVTVFDEPTLTGQYQVGVNGAITLPLLADVPAQGMTPDTLAQAIKDRLAAGGYVINPRVSVDVEGFRPFYILGEVNNPGEYPYAGKLTIMQAIAKAGGFTARAAKSSVVVRREAWGGERQVPLDGAPLLVAPGDTIIVKESFF
jgi:polysaccharide biosynthesis/export protein